MWTKIFEEKVNYLLLNYVEIMLKERRLNMMLFIQEIINLIKN